MRLAIEGFERLHDKERLRMNKLRTAPQASICAEFVTGLEISHCTAMIAALEKTIKGIRDALNGFDELQNGGGYETEILQALLSLQEALRGFEEQCRLVGLIGVSTQRPDDLERTRKAFAKQVMASPSSEISRLEVANDLQEMGAVLNEMWGALDDISMKNLTIQWNKASEAPADVTRKEWQAVVTAFYNGLSRIATS